MSNQQRIDFLTKYAPQKHNDLLVPAIYQALIDRMFSGNLQLCDKGYVFYGPYGVGKTTVVDLLKKQTGWPFFTLPEKLYSASERETLSQIKQAFYNAQDSYYFTHKTPNQFNVNPPRFIIECNEISSWGKPFLEALRALVDEFYKYSLNEENNPCMPALWMFTDNHISVLQQEAGGVFQDGRIKPVDWGRIPAKEVETYAISLLKKEGVDTEHNRKIVSDLSHNHQNRLRELLTKMSNNITK